MLIDEGAIAKTIRAEMLGSREPFVLLTDRDLAALSRELGGEEAAMRWLAALANTAERPVALHVALGQATSTSILIRPKGWSEAQLVDYLGRHREVLDAARG